jgi:hypothetical protein
MIELAHKKEIILQREMAFADAIGASVIDKPKVNVWMVFIPILFLYFIYRIQRYKNERMKFSDDFMITRQRTMDIALDAAATGSRPDIDDVVRRSALPGHLHKPYGDWVQALADFYLELLVAEGECFESMVRAAYRNRNDYCLALNGLTSVENEFYTALRSHLAATEGAADIITRIESQTQELRRQQIDYVFR